MTEEKPSGVRAFGLVWLGQLISLVGSGLTSFALGVWVYQKTGSVTQFAGIAFFGALPGLIVAPMAGVLVDRFDRRTVMLWTNLLSGLRTLAVAALLWTGHLQVWHIYVAVAVASVFRTFHLPAYIAATTLLVPKKHLARASGMTQFGQAVADSLAPFLAGLLVTLIRIEGVLLIDFMTFLFAIVTLALVRIPRPVSAAARGKRSMWKEAVYGWQFVRDRAGLRGLLNYFAMLNLILSMVSVLMVPLVLSATNAKVLGRVLMISSAGLLAGSILMSITGGPKRRIHGVLGFGLVFGAGLLIVGLRPNPWLIAAGLFITMFGAPVINGASQAIWQAKVPPEVQGRVFAVRRMLAQFTAPLGHLAAGPLADKVFGPLLLPGGALAGSVGLVLGVGKGRGIALLCICLAILPVLASLWGYAQPQLRRVEEDLPDAIGD
ncbi:MAG TPA: MFS transporter [Thermoanaerobaculia bacterium]|jgi:MFS family permease|nr:MFS transporter [Thermoanaerobaculia bacterium]